MALHDSGDQGGEGHSDALKSVYPDVRFYESTQNFRRLRFAAYDGALDDTSAIDIINGRQLLHQASPHECVEAWMVCVMRPDAISLASELCSKLTRASQGGDASPMHDGYAIAVGKSLFRVMGSEEN
ncbi:MAG: hypothetical protein ACXWCK_31920, partial [Burkholderiales bacterium]